MKFVRVPVKSAFVYALLLLCLSCGGNDGGYGGTSTRRENWKRSSDLAQTRQSNPKDMVMQERLQGLGYNPGPIDGVVGPQTKAALQRYQRDHGLLASGLPGPATRACLQPASFHLTNGYPLRCSLLGSPGPPSLGPRYPGDIAPFLGTEGGYGFAPHSGPRDNPYRILRSEHGGGRRKIESKD